MVTEDTGTYEFLGLTPGVYGLRVEKENFRRHEIDKSSCRSTLRKRKT